MKLRFEIYPVRVLLAGLMLALLAASADPASAKRARSRSRATAAKAALPTTTEAWETSVRQAESRGEQWTVEIADLASTRTVYTWHPERRLIPASNRKLITFGLALAALGPDYKFRTELGLTQPPQPGKTHYHGDVVLISRGDPTICQPFLPASINPIDLVRGWGASLAAAGIAYVHGDLVIDVSAFGNDQNRYPETWDASHRNYSYATVPSALAVNQNLLRVTVLPSKTGGPGRLTIFPADSGLAINNLTRTGAGGSVTAVFGDEEPTLQLTGGVRRNQGGECLEVPLARPVDYVAANLRDAIEDSGVRLLGNLVIRTSPPAGGAAAPRLARVLASRESPPLTQILEPMMRHSDNFLAEQLWRAAGARARGRGDVFNCRQAEQAWFTRQGTPWIEPGWDGSGLSRQNLFSAQEMVLIMRHLYNTPFRPTLMQCLPVSGRSGTLRHRTIGGMPGRVVAKTGTLAGVGSLTGFIMDRQGQPRYVFSVIGNAPGNTHGRLNTRIQSLLSIVIRQLDQGAGLPPLPEDAIPAEDEAGDGEEGLGLLATTDNAPTRTPALGGPALPQVPPASLTIPEPPKAGPVVRSAVGSPTQRARQQAR